MPNKQDVARAVGQFLGVREREYWFSEGSKVTASFQHDIGPVLGVSRDGLRKVQHMRAILESVAVPWSSKRHSSEDADNPGGNVTKEAYEDLLKALHAAAADEALVEGRRPQAQVSHGDFVQRAIRLRRGQASFREELLEAYEGACAVTRSTARAVLEAAHILPFAEGGATHPSNGLLLRSDIHTLFDLRRISIDSRNWTLLVDESLRGTEYWDMRGWHIAWPRQKRAEPDLDAVDEHRTRSGL